MSSCVLTINGGSSSIKFAAYQCQPALRRILRGEIERIGIPGTSLSMTSESGQEARQPLPASGISQAVEQLMQSLRQRLGDTTIAGIGHRVVHGGPRLLEHQPITPQVLDELRKAVPLDLAHLPQEIELIEAFTRHYADLPQIACFDTAFFRDLPRIARLFAIPRRYTDAGVRRFGFHGLSYTFLLDELRRIAPSAADGRIIFAHLGSGASMAAVHHGKPIDTTMALTPLAGLVMGTRPGDIDPGLLVYLLRTESQTPDQLDELLNRQCGLLGVSETSSDMRDLIARRPNDLRAAQAVELFCYQARKWIGSFAAALGGLETLVFSGGIGEHSSVVREEICAGLNFLGVRLDATRNALSAPIISFLDAPLSVRVIPTNEELVIARAVCDLLQLSQ